MNNKIFNYLEIAGRVALQKSSERSFLLGAVGVRRDGALVRAFNGSDLIPNRKAHAEYRLAKKLDWGAEVYVVRILKSTGRFAMSRPCDSCLKALRSKGVVKIYYTIGEREYGTIIYG